MLICRRKFDISIGDELPSGIVQLAKVCRCQETVSISAGDELAGRHGNKELLYHVLDWSRRYCLSGKMVLR